MEEEITRRKTKKRVYLENDSDPEQMDLDFQIMDFTEIQPVQLGSSTKYTVLDFEGREYHKSLREIEAVAKREGGDLWDSFVDWATSMGLYKAEYDKKPQKPKALPNKRERKQIYLQ